MPACKEMLVELFIMTFGFISLVVQLVEYLSVDLRVKYVVMRKLKRANELILYGVIRANSVLNFEFVG